nr:MAG TPA: hypothetical protein [Caudoviricetes sp.]
MLRAATSWASCLGGRVAVILIKSLVYSCVNFELVIGVNFRFICWGRERVLCSQKHQ